MHYLVTGGTGFIGSALAETLLRSGHQVTVLTRSPRSDRGALRFVDDLEAIPGRTRIDGVINLAGASLAASRWTEAYKDQIVASRLDTTEHVLRLIGRLDAPPDVLLSASAIGYYGPHGDEPLTEEGGQEPAFSQQLCARWEGLANDAARLGVRVCRLRFGVVLDREGGALTEMTRSFRLGVASWIGRGDQYLSWIHRRDAVAAMEFLLQRQDLSGPFNLTSAQPVTAREFCVALKHHFRTLITVPVPAPVIRLLVGEMADELLLSGQRVLPARLQAEGFRFAFPSLEDALAEIFAR